MRKQKKLFRAYFNPEVFNLNGSSENPLFSPVYISTENGYTDKEVDQILSLRVGQVWKSRQHGPDHTITRIQ